MSVGPATIAVVEHRRGGMNVECFKTRLEMVLDQLDSGGLGAGKDEVCAHGDPQHVRALRRVVKEAERVLAEIAKREGQS